MTSDMVVTEGEVEEWLAGIMPIGPLENIHALIPYVQAVQIDEDYCFIVGNQIIYCSKFLIEFVQVLAAIVRKIQLNNMLFLNDCRYDGVDMLWHQAHVAQSDVHQTNMSLQ